MVAGVTELRRGRPLRLLRTLEPTRQPLNIEVIPPKPVMPTPWAALAALEAARWNAPQEALNAPVKLCTLQSVGAKGNADVGARTAPASA